KYAVYGYLYTNYWPQCTHRIFAGMGTNLNGNLRDYLVAVKSATVWLDPGTAQDATLLAKFLSNMTPVNGVYMGWWPSEGNGLTWIANYGIPVLASDYFRNGSVFSGVSRPINVPDIPPPPPLENKVYVALILSDGDNVQYMQHVMKMDWGNSARGSVPIGWTTTALAADLDPVMFNHYWNTVTTNDCLISGPSGAGYTHMELWNSANLTAFTSLSDGYLQRAGLRVITIWDRVTTGIAQAFATNCPTLLGLADQNGTYNTVDRGLRTIGLTPTYASLTSQMLSGITNATAGWSGTTPLFLAAQATVWSLGPADMLAIANSFDTNKFKFVRPDHLFMLANRVFGPASAVTQSAVGISSTTATIQGTATGNATNALAWLEWGTNRNYGFRSTLTNVGNSTAQVSATIAGLTAQRIYHYRVAASNALGVVWGSDKQFSTGGRLKAWGGGTLGETNVPAGLSNVVAIASGASHGLGLRNDGTVVAWGSNNSGQTNVPPGLSNVIAVAGGMQHSLALLANGTVAAWGDNTYGQTNVPPGLNNVVAISAGANHNLALKADQTVTAWGDNLYGQTNVPAGLTNIVSVAAGFGHNLALKADGTVTAWGYNNLGQTNVPAGLNHVVAVAAGQYHSLVLKSDVGPTANLFPARDWIADTLSGSDGSSISNWLDSVAGKSAVQPVASKQPALYSNGINGHKTVRFSGANNQFLTVSSADSPISSATNFTLVVAFKTSTPGNVSSSFFLNTGLLGAEQPNGVPDWALGLNGSQLSAGLGVGNTGCNGDITLYGGNVTDGNPHIAMYVRSGNTVRLYVDGVIVGEQTALCLAARGNYPFQIGAMTTNSFFFTGDIAEVQLYNRALNALEITSADQMLATTYGMSGMAGAPVNRWSADNLSGVDGSAIAAWPDALGGKSATQSVVGKRPKLYSNVLNGHKTVRFASASSQYLTVASADSAISSAGSFTLVVVFKTLTSGSQSSLFYQNTGLLGCEQSGVVADWALCINGAQLGAGLGAGTGGCGSDLSLYGGNVTDGNPHIAMYVRSGETITLYVDGAIVATQTSLCTAARGNYPFLIGGMTATSLFFNGDIAEIDLYNRSLNASEILSANQILATTYGVGGAAGSVVAWGNNASGQANVPKNLTGVSAVASGSLFNLALATNGTVTAWGNNTQGQTNLPAGLTNVAAIAGGTTFGVAIGNQPPLAGNATFSGFVNHDLPLTLPTVNPDGNPLSIHILSPPAAGTLYQWSGGNRGPSISAPNSLVTDPAGKIIFASASGETGNPYTTFGFMCDDAVYSSAAAQVTVNIALPAAPQFTSQLWHQDPGGTGSFDLSFSGDSNATYTVWAATNLVDWLKVGTATELQPGLYDFIDTSTNNQPQRFYRISAP
ncbi:MAG: Alpha-tubulin suppressor and related protein-like protein, partial [Pedosphaera sp.]|nr:Alpha-tubulin suppressor and related protein-like protein [Pedosphaera sp.]